MRPSKIKNIKAHWVKIFGNGSAMTFWGHVFSGNKEIVDKINKTDKVDNDTKCHETIHFRQAWSIHDSWILFGLAYAWEHIRNIRLMSVEFGMIYRFNAFELEAYGNQLDYAYCDHGAVYGWKKYKKIPYKTKKELALKYKELRKEIAYKNFVFKYVNPLVS